MKVLLSPPVPFLLSILLPVCICPQGRREVITTEPYFVTPSSPEMEELYLKLRNPEPTAKPRLTRSHKWKICKKVTSTMPPLWLNNGFVKGYEIAVHPKDLEHLLMQDHRRIFDELFERRAPGLIPFTRQEPYRYKNRSILRKIFVGGNEYEETVFTCLVEENVQPTPDTDEQILRQYYVSDSDYNVNMLPDAADYIAGRFIFAYNDDQTQIVLHALAEGNSYALPKEPAESLYLEKRNDGHAPMLEAEYDPLCKMSDGRRLRLCNSTLASLRRYLPPTDLHADDQCVKKSFYLRTLGLLPMHQNSRLYYDEWMVHCTLTWEDVWTHNSHQYNYYVSRGYSDNEIFVFSTEEDPQGRAVSMVENRRRVSVVSDAPARFIFDDVED